MRRSARSSGPGPLASSCGPTWAVRPTASASWRPSPSASAGATCSSTAGIAPAGRADLLEATEASFERVLKVNLQGPYFLTQAAARWMVRQRGEDAGRPLRIVNIGSISAYTSSPSRGEYCVSKAGVAMMTALFADRLAEHRIGVFEIRPGIIATDMTEPAREKYDRLIAEGLTPLRRRGRPEDVARAVGAIAAGALDFSTGTVIDVDGGFRLRRL